MIDIFALLLPVAAALSFMCGWNWGIASYIKNQSNVDQPGDVKP